MSEKGEHIAFKCSECAELFPKELVDEILKGKIVLCERCGFPFRSSFTKKDYKEMGSPPIEAPKLKRKQTIAYNKPKPIVKISPSKKAVVRSKPAKKQQYQYQPSGKSKAKKHKRGITIDTHGLKEKVPKSDIDGLAKSIRVLNDLNTFPLIIIIGFIIFGSTIPKSIDLLGTDLLGGIMKIVVNSFRFVMVIYVWSLNYKIVIKPVRNKTYTNLGIDAILLGLISLPLYGLGTLFLAEGILILLHEIFIRHNNLIDLGKTDKLSKEIFEANIKESVIKVINEFLVKGTVFLLVYSILPILKKVRELTIPVRADFIGSLVYHAVFFGISFAFTIYLKVKFSRIVKNKSYQEIQEEVLVRCTVFSVFSLIYGAVGILGLLTCLLLYEYRRNYKSIKKKLPSIQYIKPKLAPESQTSSTTTVPKTKLPSYTPKTSMREGTQSKPTPKPPQKEKDTLQEIPVIRVDDKKARTQLITSLHKSEKSKPETPPGKPPISNNGDIKEYMDRVFTVLTADMRDRLMKLDISEDQKWDVIMEFVNLKKSQQQKYLVELEDVNRIMSEELIKRVKKMKLPKKETKAIIKQLEIMGPKEQAQFVEFLEHSQ